MARLEIVDATVRFPDARVGIDGLSLDVSSGEFVSLIGPSGSGKTTTLRAIAGLERLACGELRLDGVDVRNVEPHRRDVAMVFQSQALFPERTALANVEFALRARGRWSAERLEETLRITGLTEFKDRLAGDLSGGQKQRVALARALACQPKILLLDEPTTHLDADAREDFRRLVLDMHRRDKTTVIAATHDHAEALAMSGRVAVMDQGKLAQVGTPDEVFSRPVSRRVAELVGRPAMNLFDGLLDKRKDGAWRFRADSGWLIEGDEASSPKDAITGSRWTIGLRPQAIQASEQGEQSEQGGLKIEAEVVRSEFDGGRHWFWTQPWGRCATSAERPLVALATNERGGNEREMGRRVGLTIERSSVRWFDVMGRRRPRVDEGG